MPNVVVLAGPNGAGKTTASAALLRDALRVTTFVNADLIAQGLAGSNPTGVDFEAGRIMVERLVELAGRREDFAFETTLANRTYVKRIKEWKASGYRCHLVYLWLPSPESAINRVKDRVRRGGHHIPDDVVRRRYRSGLRNVFEMYRPLADTWRFFENAGPGGPRLIAFGTPDSQDVFDNGVWDQVHRRVSDANRTTD